MSRLPFGPPPLPDPPSPLREVEVSGLRRITLPQAVAPRERPFEERLAKHLPEPKDHFEARDASWRASGIRNGCPPPSVPTPRFAGSIPRSRGSS